jgi:acyl-coenzyme A thioesterase PaaI-like protein
VTDIPAGFAPLEARSRFLDLVGPFYGKPKGDGLVIGLLVLPRHLNRRDVVHGGMICSLIDFAMGEAARRSSDPPRAFRDRES